MKLEIKHLAPYLPYGLKVQHTEFDSGESKTGIASIHSISIEDISFEGLFCDYYFDDPEPECEIKPILRPLSDLTKEIEYGGEIQPIAVALIRICFEHGLTGECAAKLIVDLKPSTRHELVRLAPYFIVEQLISWHFDIFGLIDSNLAIDLNTIQK